MDDLHINHEELEIFRSKLFMLDGDDGWLDRGAGYPLLLKVVPNLKKSKFFT